MDSKQTEKQCAICGEAVEQNEKSEFLCDDCVDSWERELASSW
ncbi:hypothetical protein AAC03nite_13140 [Alicyclobacillus acidoterrestris]|nr:hypothetical protein [Alicyclobacillus suci]GEO25529.1 hypothetical protein AAC03nite_13140 [Alicyclobacillus acidoterrestris]